MAVWPVCAEAWVDEDVVTGELIMIEDGLALALEDEDEDDDDDDDDGVDDDGDGGADGGGGGDGGDGDDDGGEVESYICHLCLRQSRGLVRPITAAPVTHDAMTSFATDEDAFATEGSPDCASSSAIVRIDD